MMILGARLNNTLEGVGALIGERNVEGVLNVALDQVRWGADALDLCCCRDAATELEDMCWLVDLLQAKTSVRLCIDSPDPQVQRAALARIKGARPIINSATLEQGRAETMMSLAQEFNAQLVVLLHDEGGMPDTAEDRLRLMPKLEGMMARWDFTPDDILLDPLVFPLAVNQSHANVCLETTMELRRRYPAYHIVGGIDNVGHGLPAQKTLSLSMLAMFLGAGADAAMILLDDRMSAYLKVFRALKGEDAYCAKLIQAYREGAFVGVED